MAKKSETRKQLAPAEYPDWIDPKVWQEFIQFRREIKKPIFEIGEKRMLKKLEKLGTENYEEILDQSIRNNWQDIYALKIQNANQPEKSNNGLFNPADHL